MEHDSFKKFLKELKNDKTNTILESIETGFRVLFESMEEEYPVAGPVVDGLEVRSKVPNTDSISATLNDYKVLKGIREVSMDGFNASPENTYRSKRDQDWSRELAEQIRESQEINPLIVVIDKEGPYILEGMHRLVALHILGKKKFPALVVLELD